MQLVTNKSVHLDVYSSTQVYGDQFKKANDDKFKELYNQAKALKNVSYIGYKPNEFIKDNLKNYHMFAYPNIWEETSCIAAIEAMAAGLYTIVTDYGALFETCSDFAVYIPYEKDFVRLAKTFAQVIDTAAGQIHKDHVKEHLQIQIDYINRFYSWELRKGVWNKFLEGVINARSK
jgi:glycosyltransferase involved in cell wall biosynthesis